MHKIIRILIIMAILIIVPVNTSATAEEKKSETEVLSTSTSTQKVCKKLKKKSKKTYTKEISISTDITVNSTKDITYYTKEQEKTETVTRKYAQYYKGKKYKHVFTEKTISKEKVIIQTDKTDLSPEIIKTVGNDFAKAFSKIGFTVDYWGENKDNSYLSISKKVLYCYNDESLLHQLGYFLSLINDNKCYTAKFIKIYEEEKTKYYGSDKGVAQESSGEFFACCFQLYLATPNELKTNMPKTYGIIEECMNAINDNLIAEAKEKL